MQKFRAVIIILFLFSNAVFASSGNDFSMESEEFVNTDNEAASSSSFIIEAGLNSIEDDLDQQEATSNSNNNGNGSSGNGSGGTVIPIADNNPVPEAELKIEVEVEAEPQSPIKIEIETKTINNSLQTSIIETSSNSNSIGSTTPAEQENYPDVIAIDIPNDTPQPQQAQADTTEENENKVAGTATSYLEEKYTRLNLPNDYYISEYLKNHAYLTVQKNIGSDSQNFLNSEGLVIQQRTGLAYVVIFLAMIGLLYVSPYNYEKNKIKKNKDKKSN